MRLDQAGPLAQQPLGTEHEQQEQQRPDRVPGRTRARVLAALVGLAVREVAREVGRVGVEDVADCALRAAALRRNVVRLWLGSAIALSGMRTSRSCRASTASSLFWVANTRKL